MFEPRREPARFAKVAIQPRRDPARFAKVAIQYGTIIWPGYDLDIATEPLYQAVREHALTPAHSAC